MDFELNEKNILTLKSAYKILKEQGSFALTELKKYVIAKKIPENVLRVIEEAFNDKNRNAFDQGLVYNQDIRISDETVIKLAKTIYVEKLLDVRGTNPETVVSLDPSKLPLVMNSISSLDKYLLQLRDREKAAIQLMADIKNGSNKKDSVETVRIELKSLKRSINLALNARAELSAINDPNLPVMKSAANFVASGKMQSLNRLLEIVTTTTVEGLEAKDNYVQIDTLLTAFNRAATPKAPTKTRKPVKPVVGGSDEVTEVEGGDEEVRIIDEKPKKPEVRIVPEDEDDSDAEDEEIVDGGDDGDVTDGGDDGDKPEEKPEDRTDGDDDDSDGDEGDETEVEDGEEDSNEAEDEEERDPVETVSGDDGSHIVDDGEDADDEYVDGDEGAVVDPTEEPVAGSVNSAKTKKIGLGRRIINWVGRHWLLASVVVTAATLAIGAVAGPLAPAAIAVAHFASYNLATFATIGAAALGVKYFTFRKRRQANSAQAHFLSREKNVQRRIKKSQNLLVKANSYKTQIADYNAKIDAEAAKLVTITDKRERRKVEGVINGYKKQIAKLHKKAIEIDDQNTALLKGLNKEFVDVKMPGAVNIPGKIKHTVQRVTGNATLARLQAEFVPYIEKKQERVEAGSARYERLEESKLNGNLADEYANTVNTIFEAIKQMKARQAEVKRNEGEDSKHYKALKKNIEDLQNAVHGRKNNPGTATFAEQINAQSENIVQHSGSSVIVKTGVDANKEDRFYTDPTTGNSAMVSIRKDGTITIYGDKEAAKKAITATKTEPFRRK